MKKLLTGIISVSLLALPVVALGQAAAPASTVPPYTGNQMLTILGNFTDWLFTILLIVAVIFLIIAAFAFITASGDPDKVAKARNFVLYALIGVAVAVGARGLVALVILMM